ncbi:hypothetical protein HDU97_000993 [Phlyctochytrium planicorne]|nr:hypothetical protein HDU97_000993 [Phlyctochytrium planicorne]
MEEVDQSFKKIIQLGQQYNSRRSGKLQFDFQNVDAMDANSNFAATAVKTCVAAMEVYAELEALEAERSAVFVAAAPTLRIEIQKRIDVIAAKQNRPSQDVRALKHVDHACSKWMNGWLLKPILEEFLPPHSPSDFTKYIPASTLLPAMPSLEARLKAQRESWAKPISASSHPSHQKLQKQTRSVATMTDPLPIHSSNHHLSATDTIQYPRSQQFDLQAKNSHARERNISAASKQEGTGPISSALKRNSDDRFQPSIQKKRSHAVDEDDDNEPPEPASSFMTAYDKMVLNNLKKGGDNGSSKPPLVADSRKRSLGVTSSTKRSKFVSPLLSNKDKEGENGSKKSMKPNGKAEEPIDDRLKNIDPKMVEAIMNEIMDKGRPVVWDDIAGLEHAKNTIKEVVVWPMLRPDIFNGIRGPPKGFSYSLTQFVHPHSNTLKAYCCLGLLAQVGDGEKMVRALFAVARVHQPSVIFVDEIDSLLTQRTDGEFEATRRIKTEFLGQRTGPIRDIRDIENISVADVRPTTFDDFVEALTQVRASVSENDLALYLKFDAEFGSAKRP